MTASSGVVHRYRNGEEAERYTILESLGGGVALLDYDQDGLLDIFVTGGGTFGPNDTLVPCPNRLYRNEGGWHFRDVTEEAGLAGALFYSHGCAVGDYDNDGWPDLLVTGYGRLALYHNNHGKFEEVTQKAELLRKGGPHWSTSAAWADLNGDGRPDLFVAHYVDWSFAKDPACTAYGSRPTRDVCPPSMFAPLPQQLFWNRGDGTFREASAEVGLKPGKALGVLVADLDGDGRPAVYVANDTIESHLYVSRGGGRLAEEGRERGVALSDLGSPNGSMGVDAADYDGSGRLSLFVTNYQQQAHALYRNLGQGLFAHVSSQTGITRLGLSFVGFGTGFLDYDNDGAEDLVIVNGHVYRHPAPPHTLAQRPVLLHNLRRPGMAPAAVSFADAQAEAGPFFQGKYRGRGLAVGDLDNDGRVDLVISHCNEPVVLLRNVCANGNHWLGIELRGNPYRDAVGATLTLEVKGQRLVRAIKGGGSYLSSGDRRVVFGLGAATRAERLTVRWPSGRTQTWDGARLHADRYWLLEEGQTAPRPRLTGRR
jgi:hypothetical protein